MKDIIKICNPTLKFSKFTSNKYIYIQEKFKWVIPKLVWRKIFQEITKLVFRDLWEREIEPLTIFFIFYFFALRLQSQLHFKCDNGMVAFVKKRHNHDISFYSLFLIRIRKTKIIIIQIVNYGMHDFKFKFRGILI